MADPDSGHCLGCGRPPPSRSEPAQPADQPACVSPDALTAAAPAAPDAPSN
ncbi:MAG: hypothetical protein FWF20_00290 [Betaproteobacteria bacterium]|nr:hypothetical protein [Betaproteobacteria bacterium]MCL2885219.1 hypothetical protein [Betaproteobacteria bacterium]